MSKWKLLLALVAIFILVRAVHADSENPSGAITIGWTGPLTGDSAVLGVDSLTAARIAIDKVNGSGGIGGRPLQLVAEDDSYDTKKAILAFQKLTAINQARFIIASTYGGVFAAAVQAQAQGVLLLNPLDCNDSIAALPENTFCLATRSESVGEVIATSIAARSYRNIGVLYDESNPFMELVAKTLEQRLTNKVQALKLNADIGAGGDFRSAILQFRSMRAEAIVFLGHDRFGQAMREARSSGIGAQFYATGTITSPGFQKAAGSAADGALVAYWLAPRTAAYFDFVAEFKRRENRLPILELATIPSHDSVMVLSEAMKSSLEETGSIDVEHVRTELLALRHWPGLSGTITFSADGAVRTIQESLFEYRDGHLTPQNYQ